MKTSMSGLTSWEHPYAVKCERVKYATGGTEPKGEERVKYATGGIEPKGEERVKYENVKS